MLDHGMQLVGAELVHDAQHHRPRLRTLELDLAFPEIGFDRIEVTKKIVVPESAAKLAVGHGLQSDVLLPPDHLLDLAMLDRRERISADLAALASAPSLLESGRAQEVCRDLSE